MGILMSAAVSNTSANESLLTSSGKPLQNRVLESSGKRRLIFSYLQKTMALQLHDFYVTLNRIV